MNPMKILLVDDSKSARYALRLQLQRHGIKVETADAAESALEKVRETPPDAIFMDHTMPGMNGFEALDILKTSPTTQHIPVVMCTSNEDPEFIAQAKKKGALDILSKSTAPEKLATLLERLQQAEAVPEEVPDTPPRATEGAPIQPTSAVSAPAITGEPSSEQIEERIHTLIEPVLEDYRERLLSDLIAKTDERIETRVRASITPPLEELAKRLAEDLIAKTNERLVSGLERESEHLKQHFAKIQSENSQMTTNRLLNEVVPRAVRQQLAQEQQSMAQSIQELIDESLDSLVQEPRFVRRLSNAAESSFAEKAEQLAKAKATEIAETVATERADAVAEFLVQSRKRSETSMYLLTTAAALVGVAASVIVFLLLS